VNGNLIRQAVIAGCIAVAQPAAADVVTLRYGQIPSTVRSVSSLYLFVAQRQGFFTREDLKLEFVPIAGGTDKMVAALDQGAVDVAQTATPYLAVPDPRRARGIGCGRHRGRDRQPDLQPDREAGDPERWRAQGQVGWAVAADRHHLDLHAQAAGAQGAELDRL
jgi:hypothetical protein